MAVFITFEGGEGCGKSTQARALYKDIVKQGFPAVLTHEPGGTSVGKKIRHYLKKSGEPDISPLTELFLFAASRTQLVEKVIRPSLKNDAIVICDRYTHSTLAYQGYGRGLDLDTIQSINTTATGGLSPDLVVLLDLAVEKGLARKGNSREDRFEQEDIAFHRRVRQGFLKMAVFDHKGWLVVDADLPKREVSRIIRERVSKLLQEHHTGLMEI